MRNIEILSWLLSLGSASAIITGFIWQQIGAISVGSILLTAVASYYFQKRMQLNIREYEIRRLRVTEGLGPLHGDLLRAKEVLSRNKKLFELQSPHTLYDEQERMTWPKIRANYTYFLIPEALRTQSEALFTDFRIFDKQSSLVSRHISRIVKERVTAMLKFDNPRDPVFVVTSHGADTQDAHQISIFGLVFWKVQPTVHGTLEKVIVLNEGGGPYQMPIEGVMAVNFSNKLFEYVFKKSDEDPEIVKAREMHEDLLKRVSDLKVSMENEIQQWTK